MSIRDIARALEPHALQIAKELFPNGKQLGSEWCVGDIDGSQGKSLRINTGRKAGVWHDFSVGEGGDLVDLWSKAKCGGDIKQALDELKSRFSLSDPEFKPKKKSYKRPPKPKCGKPSGPEKEYLYSRGFTDETIEAFKVGTKPGQVILPFMRDGELIMCKWRDIKTKKTMPTTGDQEKCLFGWQTIPKNVRTVCITEGEFDAMAMHQMGYHALSVPYGGGGGAKQDWIENEYENLERFDCIYLCTDNDDEGEKAARTIAERLGEERCFRVIWTGFKDANECLLAEHDISVGISLARGYDLKSLKKAGAFTDQVLDEFYPPEGKEKFLPVAWPKIDGLIELREAEVSIWTGYSGSGKSQILGYIAAKELQAGKRVFIASMELKPSKTLYRMVRQVLGIVGGYPTREQIAQAQAMLDEGLWIFDCVGTAKKDELFRAMKYARKRFGVDHFIVDSLMKCGIAEDDYNGQKDFLDELEDFANLHNCHISLVSHPKKPSDTSPNQKANKYSVRGSTSITDLADSVFIVWRNREKEKQLQDGGDPDQLACEPDVMLISEKQRETGWEGSVKLWFCPASLQYLEGPDCPVRPMILDTEKNLRV